MGQGLRRGREQAHSVGEFIWRCHGLCRPSGWDQFEDRHGHGYRCGDPGPDSEWGRGRLLAHGHGFPYPGILFIICSQTLNGLAAGDIQNEISPGFIKARVGLALKCGPQVFRSGMDAVRLVACGHAATQGVSQCLGWGAPDALADREGCEVRVVDGMAHRVTGVWIGLREGLYFRQ